MQMIRTRLRYFMSKLYSKAETALLMTGKVFIYPYFLFLEVSVFQERFYTFENFKFIVVESTHANLLVWFNFYFFILVFFEEIDSNVSFSSICGIAPLIICFDLRFRNM